MALGEMQGTIVRQRGLKNAQCQSTQSHRQETSKNIPMMVLCAIVRKLLYLLNGDDTLLKLAKAPVPLLRASPSAPRQRVRSRSVPCQATTARQTWKTTTLKVRSIVD